MQYEFYFVFPYPTGCLHLSERGSDGYGIDDCARVCGYACAVAWAKSRGKILTGESHLYSSGGEILFQSYRTKYPHEIVRPSMAHLAALMRGS